MTEPRTYARRLMRPAALLLLMGGLLTSGCARTASSETERAICRELLPLPTYEAADTEASKREGAAFGDRFRAICGEG